MLQADAQAVCAIESPAMIGVAILLIERMGHSGHGPMRLVDLNSLLTRYKIRDETGIDFCLPIGIAAYQALQIICVVVDAGDQT